MKIGVVPLRGKMKSIELVPDGYEVPENTFQGFPDGKYKVKGFDWFTLDDTKQRPILVAQKDSKMVGRFRFLMPTGKLDERGKEVFEDGPPMSVTLNQMPLVAKAFGVDIKKLSSTPSVSQAGLVSQYMMNLQNLCKESNKVLEVEVSKGWVNSLPGMTVAPGYYYFQVVDITGDGSGNELKPKKSTNEKWLDYFYIEFEVVAGEGGSQSPYNGVRFTETLSYAFMVEGDKVVTQKNKDGTWTAAASRVSRFVRLAAPEAFVVNFDPPNIHNILPYMRQHILKENKTLKGTMVKEEKGSKVFLSWPSLEEATGYQAPKRMIESMDIDDKCRAVLVEALDKLAGSPTVINGSFELNEVGRKLAKEYISPLKREGIINKDHGSLEELVPEEITAILTTLVDKIGPEFRDKVVTLAVGFEPAKVEQEEDSPF